MPESPNKKIIESNIQKMNQHFGLGVKAFWCSHCERVSFPKNQDIVAYSCAYPDCEVNTRGQKHLVSLLGENYLETLKEGYVQEEKGGLWAVLRSQYHPEYPEVPELEKKYPMSEVAPTITFKKSGDSDMG